MEGLAWRRMRERGGIESRRVGGGDRGEEVEREREREREREGEREREREQETGNRKGRRKQKIQTQQGGKEPQGREEGSEPEET